MNHYGIRAKKHWQAHLPGQLAQISDQDAFFTRLGKKAETEIAQLAEAITAATPEEDGYLAETARLETARKTAETDVIRTTVLVDPDSPEAIAMLLALQD